MLAIRLLVLIALALSASSVYSMTFEYRVWTSTSGAFEGRMTLVASGQIERGDVARLKALIAKDTHKFLKHGSAVIIDSPGGNVQEALELAQLFRELMISVNVFSPARCVSACFFLYVGAPVRFADGPPNRAALAIHRPYFAQATTGRMSPSEADLAHTQLFDKARTWLVGQMVPQQIVDKLFSLPSSSAYWLTQQDVDGLGSRAPWYEEWILARCPDLVASELDAIKAQGTPREADAAQRYRDSALCESNEVYPFMERAARKLAFTVR